MVYIGQSMISVYFSASAEMIIDLKKVDCIVNTSNTLQATRKPKSHFHTPLKRLMLLQVIFVSPINCFLFDASKLL